MAILFDNDEKWNFDRQGITFWARTDDQRVRCIVSREAIRATFGGSGSKEDCLRLFQDNRTLINAETETLIRSGRIDDVPGETFKETKVMVGRIRHRP